jgi:type I restriction enzyme S subunit
MSEWIEMVFSNAICINPSVSLLRGKNYPFVDMSSIDPSSRCVFAKEFRVFNGGGSRFGVGDTLMARITPCLENGKIARFCGVANSKAHGSTEFIVIRGREGVTLNDYAYYLVKWEKVRGYAISQMSGTSGRQRVTASSFDYMYIPVPPLPEQKAIAHILGSLDDKIELNRRMNETLEAMARAIFKDWFVDFGPTRAKIEGRAPYLPEPIWSLFPDAIDPLSGLPEGWENYRLDQISIYHRQTISPQKFPNEQFELYSLPGFDSGKSPTITQGKHIKSNKTVIPSDSVLLSKLNPEIQRVWLSEPPGKARQICSTEFLVFTPSKSTGKCFLLCLFNSNNFREMLKSMVTGTSKSHQRVSPKSLLSQTVIVGNLEVFSVFEQRTGCYLTLLQKNFVESRILAELRDALLPKLMSGEIRVKDAEKLVEEVL